MMTYVIDQEAERKEILRKYRNLLKVYHPGIQGREIRGIRKAFLLAVDAHKNMRRKSGEPYIYHPLEVARIVVTEIGLGETAIICALLHDVVEDSDYSLEYIEKQFGSDISKIIDALTKVKEISDNSLLSKQAENFKKMLLTLSADPRVMLIKLADRLHNMRTLESMRPDKQLKIASETLYIFAPLAHRLGLYAIKSEMEDLALKFTEPEVYFSVVQKLKESSVERTRFINQFVYPIKKSLVEQGIQADIYGREKSVFSILKKMREKEIPFEEVYDIFAVRVIIQSNLENEKLNCWRVYSIVTDHYSPKQNRLRDWISTPKANGYESLHVTVMSQTGQWVEVQIRTQRMHEIDEKGIAAHWKYKEKLSGSDTGLDRWLNRIGELLANSEYEPLAFLEEFKLNLFADEIFVFTPKGEMRTLPANATALDFAYGIHSNIGNHCIGAKVNHKLVPLNTRLKSGDQIEVITSKMQRPKEEWYEYLVTARAKTMLRNSIKEYKREFLAQGKELLEKLCRELEIEPGRTVEAQLQDFMKIPSQIEFYYQIAKGDIGLKEIRQCMGQAEKQGWLKAIRLPFTRSKTIEHIPENDNTLARPAYEISKCCYPIPGDEVVGFKIDDKIVIHRTGCPEAVGLATRYGDKITSIDWSKLESNHFVCGLNLTGIDAPGLIYDIVKIITEKFHLNIKAFHLDSSGEVYEAWVILTLPGTEILNDLLQILKKIGGIDKVSRISRLKDLRFELNS
ncbi:MAG: bifunctional (p)ppGpp synthetase/guanosine-3',5'-bis(diphosphate) 3'-pyrophosphohydrolase [Bacteroidetes bacterium]|nr:bifunctional (p)ppGpp synthetase/guanosine-3',5'-bis(diphosphate) 3'-pyrophosphohydrolase [Bacteroidota bacterium]